MHNNITFYITFAATITTVCHYRWMLHKGSIPPSQEESLNKGQKPFLFSAVCVCFLSLQLLPIIFHDIVMCLVWCFLSFTRTVETDAVSLSKPKKEWIHFCLLFHFFFLFNVVALQWLEWSSFPFLRVFLQENGTEVWGTQIHECRQKCQFQKC